MRSTRPGEIGNTILFNSGKNNFAFYLINKLVPGDTLSVFYQGKEFKYNVVPDLDNADDASILLTLETNYFQTLKIARYKVFLKLIPD